MKELKKKNDENTYNSFQYRIWAEMMTEGIHTNMEVAPTSTMFIRAGGGSAASTVGRGSPAKAIESRTKCYKQLADLKSLVESGVLSKEEYSDEKATIMGMLKKLQ